MQIINLIQNHGYSVKENDIFGELNNLAKAHGDSIHLFMQEAINKMGRLHHLLERQGIKTLPCFTECHNHLEHEFLTHLFEQIPIFLVHRDMVGKTFDVGFIGKSMKVTVPEDNYIENNTSIDELIEEIKDGICIDDNPEKEQFAQGCYSVNDLFAVYERRFPANRPYNLTESFPQIFIWIDKIREYAENDKKYDKINERDKFVDLLSYVIVHELMHAFMDIDLLGSDQQRRFKIKTNFYHLREESLATALAFGMVFRTYSRDGNHVGQNHFADDFVREFIKSQSLAYSLGLEYVDYYSQVRTSYNNNPLEDAFFTWMAVKEFGIIDKCVTQYWLCFLKQLLGNNEVSRCFKESQLHLYESGMVNPKEVFRYQSTMYSAHDLVLKVIKEYYTDNMKNGGISRQEMKDAFPDDLNNDYNVFIDYPESTRFERKHSYKWTRDVEGDKDVIACIGGCLAIYYEKVYASSCGHGGYVMSSFVAQARKLGFDIETFGN